MISTTSVTVKMSLDDAKKALADAAAKMAPAGFVVESVKIDVGDVSNDPMDRSPPNYAAVGASVTFKPAPAGQR